MVKLFGVKLLRVRLLSRCRKLAVLLVIAALAGCVSAPLDYPKEESLVIRKIDDKQGIEQIISWTGGEDVNGFYPLSQGFDAFGARLRLMDRAVGTIDAQYFLMKPDNAGFVFAAGLLSAADRGVRVRLLLDDVFTTVKDADLAVLDAHENIEVRIFNPISRKGVYAFNYLGHFKLTNRRMHNKSFTVDNRISIVGGRNIAAEYYQLETTGEFYDFDMLAVGPIVNEVSDEFDTYWNHKLAIPLEAFVRLSPEDMAARRRSLDADLVESGNSIYAEAISTEVIQNLINQTVSPYVADARLISDKPEKLMVPIADDQQIIANELRDVLLSAEKEVIIYTPYLIPRKRGMELIREIREKGVRVTILTNSLATNNHTSVHSKYKKYRKPMLEAGVELWEARADAAKITLPDGETELDKLTLHTKGLIIDRRHVFVGSLNLDPRSIDINTEMGLLIDSPEMGAAFADQARKRIGQIAYRVELDERGRLRWVADVDGQQLVETKEPQTSGFNRFTSWFLQIAPESQL